MPTQIYIFDGHIIAARTGVLPREVRFDFSQGPVFFAFWDVGQLATWLTRFVSKIENLECHHITRATVRLAPGTEGSSGALRTQKQKSTKSWLRAQRTLCTLLVHALTALICYTF